MFKWLSTREVDEFAKALAADLVERVPAAGIDLADRKSTKKMRRLQDSVFDRIERFARDRRPNLYQRASFGNAFKWALKEAGYASETVDAWTHELLTYLTLKSRAKG